MRRLLIFLLLTTLSGWMGSPAFALTPTPTQVPLEQQVGPSNSSAWHSGTLTFDPAAVGGTAVVCTTAALSSIQPGDMIVLMPDYSTFTTGLFYAGVAIPANNQVSVCLGNVTSGSVNDTSVTFTYLWYDRT